MKRIKRVKGYSCMANRVTRNNSAPKTEETEETKYIKTVQTGEKCRNKKSSEIQRECNESLPCSNIKSDSQGDPMESKVAIKRKKNEINHETNKSADINVNAVGIIKEKLLDNNVKCSELKYNLKREHTKDELEFVEAKNQNKSKEKCKLLKAEDKVPHNWLEVVNNLRKMRKNHHVPIVSDVGDNKCVDENSSAEVTRYQHLLSLMLSSQTKDQVTFAAMKRLLEHGCTVENILATTNEKLGELIYPVSFWKSKVKYIKGTTEILKKDYNCDIPNTVKDLCALPGVGPKMAHICMKTSWGKITGIVVDTHVHRTTNRLGWVNTKTPEETRKTLEEWLPFDMWSEVDDLLVFFGQQTCKSVKPQCSTCLNYNICPFGINFMKKELF